MVNHSALCRSMKYDYMNILTWAILKKTQILNGCETFAFKYNFKMHVWSTTGSAVLSFSSQIHEALKINAILASQKYSFICILGLSKRYSYVF